MKAIETKYIGPTNYRGSRIKAFTEGGNQITIGYDHSLESAKLHLKAAIALRDKMTWKGKLIGGGSKGGYCFVFENSWIREE